MTITPLDQTLVLAPEGFEAETQAELGAAASRVVAEGRLFAVPRPSRDVAWAANVWLDPVRIVFESIDEAARALRSLGERWSLLPHARSKASSALTQRLPVLKSAPMAFPSNAPSSPLGAFTFVASNEILASARCTSPFPNGEVTFVEDRRGPPSRAYLKLWEAWTRLGRWPRYGDRCIDLGSSPGGWTWAMQRLDAWVLSVDKAPLDRRIARLPRVECRRASAFGLDAKSTGKLDWIVSDVVCYPERLLKMLDDWIEVHPAASYVATIKFQGATDMTPVRAFVARHGGALAHLHHNKHELTWMRLGERAPKRPAESKRAR